MVLQPFHNIFGFFRSKRKVLGRKEPPDSFGSRQSLVSPVKHSSGGNEYRNMTLGSSQRSSSRNENFMALLQKKGSKSSSGGARVSAMELLKSTNPLARRVTEFSNTSFGAEEAETGSGIKPNDQWKGESGYRHFPNKSFSADRAQGPKGTAPTSDWPFFLSRMVPPMLGAPLSKWSLKKKGEESQTSSLGISSILETGWIHGWAEKMLGMLKNIYFMRSTNGDSFLKAEKSYPDDTTRD